MSDNGIEHVYWNFKLRGGGDEDEREDNSSDQIYDGSIGEDEKLDVRNTYWIHLSNMILLTVLSCF